MSVRPPIDRVVLYRTFAAELQHGERGARSRAARRLSCSRQYVDQVVREIESARPLVRLAVGVATRNTADIRLNRPEPAETDTEPTVLPSVDIDPDDLVYRDPPFAYPRPLPRISDCANLRDSVVIMSNSKTEAASRPQPSEFRYELTRPIAQLQPCASSSVANARLAANLSIAAAWFLTLVSYLMVQRDLRLWSLWVVTMAAWWAASVAQRELRIRTCS